VAATIAWRGIWYVENSHHVSHISVAATIAWRGICYVKNSHHVSHISVAATIAWRGIWYLTNSHHVSVNFIFCKTESHSHEQLQFVIDM